MPSEGEESFLASLAVAAAALLDFLGHPNQAGFGVGRERENANGR